MKEDKKNSFKRDDLLENVALGMAQPINFDQADWTKMTREISPQMREAAAATRAAASVKPPAPRPPEEPAWNDPKAYNDAPFSIESGNEDIILNSGAFQLTYPDLTFPGRNGFDLALSRRYDSSNANTEDLNLYYDDETGDRWNCVVYRAKWQDRYPEMLVRMEQSFYFWKSKSDLTREVNRQYGGEPEWHESDGTFDNRDGYYDGYIWNDINESKTKVFMRSNKRPNDHFFKLYGLGYGWRLMFPSIERVVTQDYRTRYKTFLHLETGLSLPINDANNGFDKYPLKDVTLQYAGGAYTVSYKDGRKAYFDTNNRLNRMTDRFGNQISFAYNSTGRMNQITDSFGRVLSLELSGGTLSVKRQDTGEVLCSYGTANGELSSFTDKAGRTTGYTYSRQIMQMQMSRDETGDLPVDVTYVQLTTVTHPTGAQTQYTYEKKSDGRYETPYEGRHDYFALSSRKDIPNPALPAEACLERSFSFHFAEKKKTERDDEGNPVYGIQDWGTPYIDLATVMTHKNASGAYEIKETTKFTEDGFKDTEKTFHLINGAEKRVEQHEYAWKERLLTLQIDSYLNYDYVDVYDNTNVWQRILEYTYTTDKKGDILKQKEWYPARSSCDQEKNFVYDGNYSIPLEQSVLLGQNRYRVEKHVLRSETDGMGKVPEWKRIYERESGVDTLKERVQFVYGEHFRVIAQRQYYGDALETSAAFLQTDFTYDNSKLTDEPASQQMSGVTDVSGALIDSPFGAGVIRTAADHDWFGRTISQTDANNHTTVTLYDGIGRVLRVTNPDSTFKATAYDDAANKITVTDENGVSHRYEYTPLGKIAKDYILAPDTLLSEFRYDQLERKVTELTYSGSGAAKATSVYTYDLYDMVLTRRTTGTGVDMQENHNYDHAYDLATFLEQTIIVGDNNAPSISKFTLTDPLGNVVTEQIGTFVTQYEYDRMGNKTLQIDPRGYGTVWSYDYAGKVIQQRNAVGKNVYSTYDNLGRKTSATDYAGSTTLFTYDAAGRMIKQESPFESNVSAITKYFYDPAGNVLRQEILCSDVDYEPGYNDEWKVTRYTYDNRGRLVDTILDDNENDREIRTRYAYDSVGNKLTQHTGMIGDSIGGAAKTSYTYNRFGKLLTMTDPLNQTERYVYDNAGLLISKTDRNGGVTSCTYDALDRVLTETATGGATVTTTHTYTKTGQKLTEGNGTLTSTFRYDIAGRMIWQSESDGTVKDFAYDASGNRIGFRLTRGGVTELDLVYNYDQLNRVTEVGRNNITFVKYAYDANGNRTMNQYPASNIYTGYEYNQANLVVTVDNYIGSDQPSYFYYTYTLDGNQIYKSTMDSGYDYSYDHMGRLIEENYNDGSTYTYTYDRFSNRASLLAEYDDDYETVYTYDLNNRLLSEVKTEGGADTTTTYTYDANGNQLTKVTVDGTETRGYNGLGQLISVSGNDTPATYAYRPDGLRYSKTTGGVTHAQLWDGQNVVAEVGVNNVVNTRYLRGVNLAAREIDGALQYYQFDAHGDVLHRIDASGNVLKTYVYDAFGVETDPEPLDTNPFRYCGEYFDRETGTYYLRARNYDPSTGRFGSEDSAQIGINWYIYAYSNPVRMADPSGLDAIVITAPGAAFGFGHTSVIVEDTRTNTWSYFYWGNSSVYFEPVPEQSLSSLDAFNSWNTAKDLRANTTGYKFATYIQGDFNATSDYFADLVSNTKISHETKKRITGSAYNPREVTEERYKNPNYDLFERNCLQQSYAGLSKGTLPNGTSFENFMGKFNIIIPNDAMEVFASSFMNTKFTKTEAYDWIESKLFSGSARQRSWNKTMYGGKAAKYADMIKKG